MKIKLLKSALVSPLAALLLSNPGVAQVYIPLGSDNAIAVIDPQSAKVTGRIDGLPAVHGLAATPDGRLLIAGSYSERPVDGKMPEKPEGVAEDEHQAHHGGGGAASEPPASKVVSTVSVIDRAKGMIIRKVDVPGAVHHVAVDPQGRRAAVTHPDKGAVSLIDLIRFDVRTVATGPSPNYGAFSPDGGSLYVSNAGNGTVSDVDVGEGIVARNVRVGDSPEHIVLAADGRTLFVNNVNDGTVSAIATADWAVRKTYQAGSVLHGLDLSADGKTLIVADLGDDKVAVIDVESGNRKQIDLAPAPYHLARIDDPERIYVVSSDEPKVWVLDPLTMDTMAEIDIGAKGHQIVQIPQSSMN